MRLAVYGDRILGRLVKWGLRLLRRTDPDRASDLCGAVARRVGPWLPTHRIGQANLRAAFPDKDAAWIEQTLREAWENLGRTAGEYVHMARIWDFDLARPNSGRILTHSVPLFDMLKHDGKPALCFAAHLGNWELPAIAAAAHGLPSAVVYRMPNNKAVAKEIARLRAPLMGRLIRTRAQAALEMAAALDAGLHLGMLVDQHFSRGVDATFFGRRCKANPAIARLARKFDCPVVGVRVIRLPGHRFEIKAEGPYTLPKGPDGQVDVQAATQMILTIIEGWIREHPGQWLWFHRRWR
ncbi:MAG TPA: lipid A biosynthesis lauroyl acyltransferase [Rhodopila sp.]|nr:lipid A biosynthesis lauroyl acyltransferase [Rhodopila sp.]